MYVACSCSTLMLYHFNVYNRKLHRDRFSACERMGARSHKIYNYIIDFSRSSSSYFYSYFFLLRLLFQALDPTAARSPAVM